MDAAAASAGGVEMDDHDFYENKAVEEKLFNIDMNLALYGFLTYESILEELKLLAESMSTHQALAKKIGISEAYLCDILKGRRNPGKEVCKFLGVSPMIVYKEIKK